MRRILVATILLLANFGFLSSSALANDGRSIPDTAIESSGLRVEWFTQVASGVRASIIDMYMNVNENKTTTFYELSFGRGREVVSEKDFDAFGEPRGIEGAQEHAELRQEIIKKELEARGFEDTEVTIQKYTLPESSLYTLTSDGLVTAIDADTGNVRWSIQVGTHTYPSIGIGANNAHVAAINGSHLYCLEAATGKIMFLSKCDSTASSSPALSDEYVYVPLSNGRMQVFSIEGRGLVSQSYIGSGRALSRPLVTEKSVSWSTTAGHLNVAMHKQRILPSRKRPPSIEEETKQKSAAEIAVDKAIEEIKLRVRVRESIGGISYRLKANDEFVSAATYKSGLLFVSSVDGFVYAIDEAKGVIIWQFATGDEIETSPIPIGNDLYVVTTGNKLHKLDAQIGGPAEGWSEPVPKIREYIGAGKDKLYVKDTKGNLVVLGQDRGQRLGQVAARGLNLSYQNTLSDRIYVGNKSGMIQCLREASSKIPYFHSADFLADMDDKAKAGEGPEKAMEVDEDDPFAGFDTGDADKVQPVDAADNPFGGGAADKTDDQNPFGGAVKPADKPADKSDDDSNPFGGGGDDKSGDKSSDDDNPFGGGGGGGS